MNHRIIKFREAIHSYLTLGGVILILLEGALKAIEAHKEGNNCTLIDAILPFIGSEMYQGFRMNSTCRMFYITNNWEMNNGCI